MCMHTHCVVYYYSGRLSTHHEHMETDGWRSTPEYANMSGSMHSCSSRQRAYTLIKGMCDIAQGTIGCRVRSMVDLCHLFFSQRDKYILCKGESNGMGYKS